MAKKPLPPRPVDPPRPADADANADVVGTGSDLIFYEEAEVLLNCSRQTIDRIRRARRNKGKINIYEERVADPIGRGTKRPMLSRTELLDLFVRKPASGEPIITRESIPKDAKFIEFNGKWYTQYVDPKGRKQTHTLTEDLKYLAHPWYLREDGKKHYDCSDGVFHNWKDRDLTTRSFYIIREIKGRSPKRVTAYCGWDLDVIDAARAEREGYRKRVEEFMTELAQYLPILASDALALATEAQFNGTTFKRGVVFEIKNEKSIKTKTRRVPGDPNRWWCLDSNTLPDADQAKTISSANAEAFRKRKPGFFNHTTPATAKVPPASDTPNGIDALHKTIREVHTIVTESSVKLNEHHSAVDGKLDKTIEAINDLVPAAIEPEPPMIYYHGDLSFSFAGQMPVNVPRGERDAILAFLDKVTALDTLALES
jgi:hypothetical protein